MKLYRYAGTTLEEDFAAKRAGEPESQWERPTICDGRIKGPKNLWR